MLVHHVGGSPTAAAEALRELVTGLVDELRKHSAEVMTLRAENTALREDNASLRLENTRLKVENQLLRDEIARLKNLPPRPPFRPSGMEKATGDKRDAPPAAGKKPHGPKLDLKRVSREQILHVGVPPGSRFKGYKSCHVPDLVVTAELVRCRLECWITPDGKIKTPEICCRDVHHDCLFGHRVTGILSVPQRSQNLHKAKPLISHTARKESL